MIQETLESIAAQSYIHFECIVVDDHSTDETVDVVSAFAKADSRFSILKRPYDRPKGANACRNVAFENSNGVYIKWFDSDDVMTTAHLSESISYLQNNNLDFVVADSVNFTGSIENRTGRPYSTSRLKELLTPENYATQLIGWITDDFLGKREVLIETNFNEQFSTAGDEYNFFVRLLHKTIKGDFLDSVITSLIILIMFLFLTKLHKKKEIHNVFPFLF